MAEVPPGPNALAASPTEIRALPVDGCCLLGNNEKLDCGRGDIIIHKTEQQEVPERKGIVKPSQNNVHHPNASDQLHSSAAQVNGIGTHPEGQCGHILPHNHRHPPYRATDHQTSAFERSDSERSDRNSSSNTNVSLIPSNGIDSSDPAAITEPESAIRCVKAELDRTVSNDHVQQSPGVALADQAALVDQIANLSLPAEESDHCPITYVRYESELQMPDIIRLITKDLSEPYSIYTYRYFIHNWPQLCFLAMVEKNCVGAIVCKLDMHKKMFRRGYIAMLAVDSKFRRKGIGTNLVKKAIYAMVEGDCDEVVLETEITNKSALKLYENLGFVRDKRLFRYYLNGVDALRLKLWLR
ncbi:N-alpha-acetyltransferase 30 [Trichomycterus rosablanca]|uniref:N-alpha-acetyltransferase 30 n=1 Tax=Trichomycterus rosablanca TaxID=2290929 RepID=UPI002F353192